MGKATENLGEPPYNKCGFHGIDPAMIHGIFMVLWVCLKMEGYLKGEHDGTLHTIRMVPCFQANPYIINITVHYRIEHLAILFQMRMLKLKFAHWARFDFPSLVSTPHGSLDLPQGRRGIGGTLTGSSNIQEIIRKKVSAAVSNGTTRESECQSLISAIFLLYTYFIISCTINNSM